MLFRQLPQMPSAGDLGFQHTGDAIGVLCRQERIVEYTSQMIDGADGS